MHNLEHLYFSSSGDITGTCALKEQHIRAVPTELFAGAGTPARMHGSDVIVVWPFIRLQPTKEGRKTR